MDNSEIIKSVNGNDVKSLSLSALTAFTELGLSNPEKRAWDFAVDVIQTHGKNLTPEVIHSGFEKHMKLKEVDLPADKSVKQQTRNTHKKHEITKELDSAANGVINSNLSINEKARTLLTLGYTVSQISKAINKPYQRIKNVQKLMEKGKKDE